jgi:hypothetical protein
MRILEAKASQIGTIGHDALSESTWSMACWLQKVLRDLYAVIRTSNDTEGRSVLVGGEHSITTSQSEDTVVGRVTAKDTDMNACATEDGQNS